MCSSPKLIAACHVLLRLLEPRHSLCALTSLILLLFFFPACEVCLATRLTAFKFVHRFPQSQECLTSSEVILISGNSSFVNLFILYVVVKELVVHEPVFTGSGRSDRINGLRSIRISFGMVGPAGLEPATPALSRRCSNQLS